MEGVLGDRVMMEPGSIQRFMTQVREHALEVIDFKRHWEEYEESMVLMREKVRESDLKQSLEANVMSLVLELQTEEMVAQFKESMTKKLEEREKELSLSITEKFDELKKEEDELEVKKKSLELKEKELEEIMSEFDVRKHELEAREKEQRLVDETIKEKSNELNKKEEEFKLKQEAEARDIEVKMNSLEVKEKTFKELEARHKEVSLREETIQGKVTELEKRNEKQEAEAKEIEVKRHSLELKEKQLEERESLLEQKKRELDEQDENNRKRSRDGSKTSLFVDDPLIHTGKKLKSIREHNHYGKESETDSDFEVLYGNTSSDIAAAKGREIYEVECIDDEDDEDPESYNCLDADFSNFNNTMSSFSVGQVWALYDPSDHMPRYYAKIRKILKLQLRVEVTWLESESEKPLPIACGKFKYGEKTTTSHLMFSHEMHHIRTWKKTIIINPRKGETWALFRDWKKSEQHYKRPYSYDFVQIESELDNVHGIGVAYLGRVDGFTSVYKHAPQHECYKMMIPSDEMLRFSHRVPSFELTGDDDSEGGVPAGYFELDPAAIPRDYLEAFNVKEEEEGLGLSLLQV